jgi:hypothetical protein
MNILSPDIVFLLLPIKNLVTKNQKKKKNNKNYIDLLKKIKLKISFFYIELI